MGYGIKLTDVQRDGLEGLRLTTASADVFRNCLVILMSESNDSIATIAGRLGCSSETVKRIRKLYRMGGVNALHPIKPPGRPSRATPAFCKALRKVVQTSPMKMGYGFSTWTAGRLAQHMAKTTGVRLGDVQLRRILHREGLSYQRPKHTLKGKRDPAAYEKARRQLNRLKKGRRSPALVKS